MYRASSVRGIMYEAGDRQRCEFEAETVRRMREVFGGHTCSECSSAAERLCGGTFYCREHYPDAKGRPQIRSPRVYRCVIAAE
jgi:hypothetical protein